jgi:hypothetical protein
MKTCTSLFSYACLSALMLLLAPAHGWTTNPSVASSKENRASKTPNNMMKDWHKAAAAAAVSAALAASPMVANAAPVNFAGSYSDPFHPNCQRVILKDDKAAASSILTIRGTDGNPGCPPDGSGTPWTLTGQVGGDGSSILVDFTPKGGPPNLKGTWDGSGIMWPDGNKWTKTSS